MKTNKSSVRRSLIVSATALVLTVTMLIGTTFAWFTDSVTSGKNKIQAGNLKVDVQYSTDFTTWNTLQSATNLFTSNEWEPGHTKVVYLKVTNAGSLALDYTLAMNIANEVGSTNVNGKPFTLSQFIKYGIVENVTKAYTNRDDAIVDAEKAGTANITTGTIKSTEQLLSKDTRTLALVVYMPGKETGNDANHAPDAAAPSLDLGITLRAVQSQYESDSFNNTYDASADGNPNHPEWDYINNTTADVTFPANRNGDTVLTNSNNTVKVTVPSNALEEDTTRVQLTVEPTAIDADNVTVDDGNTAQAYNITVTGIKGSGTNTAEIAVELFIGKGLDDHSFKAYHKNTEIAGAKYDPETGIVKFTTTSFSPFTFVYKQPQAIRDDGSYTYNVFSDMGDLEENESATWKLLEDSSVSSLANLQGQGIDATLDLNGHTLTLTANDDMTIENGAKFTMMNGTFVANNMRLAYSGIFFCKANSSVTLKNVTVQTNGSVLFPSANDSSVNVIDSTITAGGYGIGTNAGNGNNLNVVINVKNSSISTNAAGGDDSAIYLNVVGTLNVENSTITGNRQGMFVRGGTATIKNSTIATTGKYANNSKYLTTPWGSGNEIPTGALIVGNRENGNAYPANVSCTLENTTLEAANGSRTIYLYAQNAAGTQKVDFNYDDSSSIGTIEPSPLPAGVTVNGVASTTTE